MINLSRDFDITRVVYVFTCGCRVDLPWEKATISWAQQKHSQLIQTGNCKGKIPA